MKQISRRELLATSGSVAGLTFLPAHLLGRDDGVVPPSERMNLAFVGIGIRGAEDLRQLAELKQNVVAVCDVDWSTPVTGRGGFGRGAVVTANNYPDAKRYEDYRKMFEEQEKNIDGVVIATPDHTHAVIALQAMKMK